ncbi:hypothetical protein BS47DRAFT_1411338 [Hydnum rufescens UP504]|uniref:CNH domain-containing protein n=1 Tax=Hydnum rufescens UP504 TaxID=1448309 RepID=A0A9P6AQ34_9AGAM|nr:hypothetical protein BS47DRAFT_1411338 [Hydnum rufescens UP504]
MPPFVPVALLHGIKERVDALLLQGMGYSHHAFGGEGYVGGVLFGRKLMLLVGDNGYTSSLIETKPNFTRRSMEQLGYIRDANSLVALSDGTVTLFPLPKLGPPTPLTQAFGALAFAIQSSVQLLLPDGGMSSSFGGNQEGEPTVVSQLVIGCRRKIVIYTWKDGEAQDVKELNLPHSPRGMAFCNPQMLVLAYGPADHAIVYLNTMSVAELSFPSTSSANAGLGMAKVGMGALTGLGGYMGLGVKANKPSVIQLGDGEALVTKESTSTFIGSDGKPSRPGQIDWSVPPEDVAFIRPFVLSTLPPTTASATLAQSIIKIRSSLSLADVQTLPFPFSSPPDVPTSPPGASLRLLTASPGGKSPACLVTTPTDKVAAAAEGSTIWLLSMQSWGQQIDELVDARKYTDALVLLDTVDRSVLADKDRRISYIRGLQAVSLFSEGNFDEAINTFLELDINPAKVVSLYPDSIAGRLAKPRDQWITLFGGKPSHVGTPFVDGGGQTGSGAVITTEATDVTVSSADVQATVPSGEGKIISPTNQTNRQSVETLLRYLSDRRPKLSGALATHNISPSRSFELPFLSETTVDDLLALPDAPLLALVPNQLLLFAQIVDTALFKSYLVIRPGLVGSLCRLDNWCEVSEVEEVLRERKGKKMHEKALALLHDLSKEKVDLNDKLEPAIRYLQKLGPEHLPLIFNSAQWVIDADHGLGLQIFTAEEVQLPRGRVADFLMGIDATLCIGFIENLIDELGETDSTFHDRLADLYLKGALDSRQTEEARQAAYAKLLRFVRDSRSYRPDRLFSRLPPNSRAILLGRLGKHEAALEIYVYRLHDYSEAEEYCKSVYNSSPDPTGVFLTLLRIYLRPTPPSSSSPSGASPTILNALLIPAIDLISRHSPRMDPVEVLKLLPPLVPASDVRAFLLESLNGPRIQTQVLREIWKAKEHDADAKLINLQGKRARVTDSRICPQCHKRLGNSAIAVHAPRGEVTHYQCREAFATQKLSQEADRRF